MDALLQHFTMGTPNWEGFILDEYGFPGIAELLLVLVAAFFSQQTAHCNSGT